MGKYLNIQEKLWATPPSRWLVTGACGFIGSNLVEALLRSGQFVHGMDNLVSSELSALDEVLAGMPVSLSSRFTFFKGDIRNFSDCKQATRGVDFILHHAALASTQLSQIDPRENFETNSQGFVNVLAAAKDAGVRRIVFASSSAVYGNHPSLPKKETDQLQLLSPYALSKFTNEQTAEVFHRCYGIDFVGLRYFNIYGPRQSASSLYAAVIPQWIKSMMTGDSVYINGDGHTSRDFCYVMDTVKANLLAATTQNTEAVNRVYNIGLGKQTSLNELFSCLRDSLLPFVPSLEEHLAIHRNFRANDITHSVADISMAQKLLDFQPEFYLKQGIENTIAWNQKARMKPASLYALDKKSVAQPSLSL